MLYEEKRKLNFGTNALSLWQSAYNLRSIFHSLEGQIQKVSLQAVA